MGDYGRVIADGFAFLFYAAAFFFILFVASLFVIGLAFTSLWSPWCLLVYPIAIALYIGLRLTVLSLD